VKKLRPRAAPPPTNQAKEKFQMTPKTPDEHPSTRQKKSVPPRRRLDDPDGFQHFKWELLRFALCLIRELSTCFLGLVVEIRRAIEAAVASKWVIRGILISGATVGGSEWLLRTHFFG
jgi:hypothetical protein